MGGDASIVRIIRGEGDERAGVRTSADKDDLRGDQRGSQNSLHNYEPCPGREIEIH